ncbi:MAG: tRNA pseudouridine(55) synthase TruB [Chloroflexi bacterium]|nr:tRNA pseudouridine(55) synthase TruB [Chloroflexota bacterium]MBT5628098.1 tRNA pseudouridine(55) synthase TruB [Chloroflexota bacterium]
MTGESENTVRKGFSAGGYLNINKPQDWTSTDVVRKLKGITRSKKIGHGGTLDPLATGVLPICVGSATRFADTVLLGTKSYRITMELGSSTNTYDSTGDKTVEAEWSAITREDIVASLDQFRGKFDQIPPMFSALHHNGKRLYELARQGIEVERPARPVETFSLELIEFNAPEAIIDVECGHGFYARTLAHDIGESLGSHAHLTGLVRTHAGAFKLEDTVTIEQVAAAAEAGDWREVAMPIDTTLQHMAQTTLSEAFVEMVKHGRQISVGEIGKPGEYASGDRIRAYTPENELLAILVFEPEKLGWRPEKVLAAI